MANKKTSQAKSSLKSADKNPDTASFITQPASYTYLAFLFALVSTLGSLYFSEIRHFTPCVLCWYQRICMYPLVIITAVGILHKDKSIYLYILPLSIIGLIISIYHNLLYYNIIPEAVAPCVKGVSCTTHFIAWFGFITIPLLSFTGFLLISASMLVYKIQSKKGILN